MIDLQCVYSALRLSFLQLIQMIQDSQDVDIHNSHRKRTKDKLHICRIPKDIYTLAQPALI